MLFFVKGSSNCKGHLISDIQYEYVSIMNMYTNQESQVKWNTVLSSKCKTSNGVKQGGSYLQVHLVFI